MANKDTNKPDTEPVVLTEEMEPLPPPAVVEENPAAERQAKDAVKKAAKRQKEQEKARAKQQKELEQARRKQAEAAIHQNAVAVGAAAAGGAQEGTVVAGKPPELTKKQQKRNRRHYGEVYSTARFLGAYVLMLIPGINILCVLVWALGGARNRNKINFSRASILFFLIEVLLSALLLSGVYIYSNSHQAKYLQKADEFSGGLVSYFDIDSYRDLGKLRNISDYLKEKTPEEPVPTRVMENPEEITSYEQFLTLYSAFAAQRDGTAKADEAKADEAKPEEANPDEAVPNNENGNTPQAAVLGDILKAHNIDPKKPGMVYIILNNGNNDSIIAFDPTGEMADVPTMQVSKDYIYVGGGQ